MIAKDRPAGLAAVMFKRFVIVGEEKLSEWADRMLNNEQLAESLSGVVQAALNAREQAQNAIKASITMLNVPTLDDLRRLEDRLGEVETLFSDIREHLDKLESKKGE